MNKGQEPLQLANKQAAEKTLPGQLGIVTCRTLRAIFDDDKVPSYHNFDGDPKSVWRLTSLATGAGVKSFDDVKNGEIIKAKYFYAHPVEIANEKTGEINNPIRVVFITDSDVAYGFVSDFVAHETDTMRSIFGEGPWMEPLCFSVEEVRTRKGFRVYTLKPVQ